MCVQSVMEEYGQTWDKIPKGIQEILQDSDEELEDIIENESMNIQIFREMCEEWLNTHALEILHDLTGNRKKVRAKRVKKNEEPLSY